MVFTKKAYEIIIHLFLKDPSKCNRGKEYRLAKFMLNMIPDLGFWKTVEAQPVTSLTYFLTKENKSLFKTEYMRYLRLSNFSLSKLKGKKYELKDEKVGGSNSLSRNKKLNLLEFIKNAEKEKN